MYTDIADMSVPELLDHFEHTSKFDMMLIIQGARCRERALERALQEAMKFLPPPPVIVEKSDVFMRALERLLRRKTDKQSTGGEYENGD